MIVVEIVRISGNRITLGNVAPADVKILRAELEPVKEACFPAFAGLNRAS